MTTQTNPATVGQVAPTTVTRKPFGIEVGTQDRYWQPGVSLRINLYRGPRDLLSCESSAFMGAHLDLTPDDADELAAALIAHAFDFRRLMDGNEDRAAVEARGVQA